MSENSLPSRARFEALDPAARARWLDPAEEEFCAHGFENASLNRIVVNAGESKGRTYHYFADKGALFRATLERRLEESEMLPALGGALPMSDGEAYWAELALRCAHLTRVLQKDGRLAALIRVLHREAAAQAAFAAPLATLHDQIAAMLAAGQAIGAVRDDLPRDLLTEVALSLLVTIDRWFARHGAQLPDEDEAMLSQRAFSLLRAPFVSPEI